MKKLKKYFIWYLMFTKRLLHKVSFIVLLCLIPAIIPVANTFLTEESGIIHVVLCQQDEDPATLRAIEKLKSNDSVIQYSICHSEEEAIRAVETFQADAAWIFEKNLSHLSEQYVLKKSKAPLVKTIHREDNTVLQLSREMLYGALYEDIGYNIYEHFAVSNADASLSEQEIRDHYESIQRGGDIVEIQYVNSEVESLDTNYLTAPLRGILALLIVLCTMAAAIYYLKDQQEGKYDWLSPQKRLVPAFALCLSASVLSSLAVYLALQVTGLSTGLFREFLSLFLFVLCATGFSLVLCVVFRSPGKLGATVPALLILMLVFSPIFFGGSELRFLRLCLPSHYYLYSTYDSRTNC